MYARTLPGPEKTTLIMQFFLRGWYPASNTSGPPGVLVETACPKVDHENMKQTHCIYTGVTGFWCVNLALKKSDLLVCIFVISS